MAFPRYWLVKSEPSAYSWDQFEKDGETTWDGVRNYQARNNLAAMKKGDKVLFYHSNEGLEVVGIASVSKEGFRDESAGDDDRWVAVKLKPLKKLKKPVTLKEFKSDPVLSKSQLVKLSRISVAEFSEAEFKRVADR